MGVCDKNHGFKMICILLIVVHIFLVRLEEVEAVRALKGEKWLMQRNLVIQTLPRGPVRPSGPNPCSNTPGGRGRCTLAENEVNFVAHSPAEPAFPDMNMVRFAAAAAPKEMTEEHQQEESRSS